MSRPFGKPVFSDPYSRQLLGLRVVTRPKDMLKMRSKLAFLPRLYLEPILIGPRCRPRTRDLNVCLCEFNWVLRTLPLAMWMMRCCQRT